MVNTRRWEEGSPPPSVDYGSIRARVNLLFEVGRKVGTVSQFPQLIEQITDMTRRALNAAASSILLLDEPGKELSFEVSGGPVGERLQNVKIDARSGIAGWVAAHGQPLIVNDVSRDKRFNRDVDEITGFVTSAILCAPLVLHHRVIGVIEVLNKIDGSGFASDDLDVLISVAATAAMAIENFRSHRALLNAYKGTARALSAAIDAKDPYTGGHSQRVTEYVLQGAARLSLPPESLDALEYAGILHDVGKIGISESILNNSGALSTEEWRMMRQHPAIGVNILKEIPFLAEVVPLVLHHHERYDGSGYPGALKGEEIPLGARLLAIADAYEAMTSPRVYRPSLTHREAITELERNTGTQFDPQLVNAFVSLFEERQECGVVRGGLLNPNGGKNG